MPTVAKIVLIVYALLMLAGGIGGYKAAASKMSLVAGLISFLLLIVARVVAHRHPRAAFGLGLLVALALAAVFAKRARETGKMMPSGMLCGLSLLVAAIMGIALAG